MKEILENVQGLKESLTKDRRIIHQNPEIGFELPKTTAYVMERLKELGYEPKEISKSAVVATVGTGFKTILLRCDMDALPVKEVAEVPYKSCNDNSHVCGHDMHTAMMLGAAEVLKNHEADLKGTVKLMFQPAEEFGLGAKAMIEAGVLNGVDAAMALHVKPDLEPGKVLYTKGTCTAAMDSFIIEVQGKGAHSSTPHLGVDPLIIVNTIYTLLNTLIGREVDPFETATLTVGKMGGGTMSNIIPETATLEGSLRCFNPEVRDYVVKRMYEIIDTITKLMRGSYSIKSQIATPATQNDTALCEELHKYIGQVIGEENVIIQSKPFTGTEDMAYISEKVPTMLAWLGAGHEGNYALHNPNIFLDENAMPYGVAVLVNSAISWLQNN